MGLEEEPVREPREDSVLGRKEEFSVLKAAETIRKIR